MAKGIHAMHQIQEISFVFFAGCVIQIPLLIIYNLIMKQNVFKHIRVIAIIAYILVIINLTLWPPISPRVPIAWSDISYNLQPFETIRQSMNHFYYMVGVRNILGNFALLLPLAMLLRVRGHGRAALYGFSISLSIEIVQMLLTKYGFIYSRAFDVDDLILNTLGFYVGFIFITIFKMLVKRRNLDSRKGASL